MKAINILINRRVQLLMLVIFIMLLSGCKIYMKNEIWLNKNYSGKALLQADVEVEKDDSGFDESELTKYNVMQEYIDKIGKYKGVKLISKNIINKSDAEKFAYTYQVEFKFDDIASLNAVMESNFDPAFMARKDGNKKVFKVYPPQHSMIQNSDLMNALYDLGYIDVQFNMIVHTPTKVAEVKGWDHKQPDDKTVAWNFSIDEYWQDEPIEELALWFE